MQASINLSPLTLSSRHYPLSINHYFESHCLSLRLLVCDSFKAYI